jgi:peroxiredoxin
MSASAQASAIRQRPDQAPSKAARELVRRGVALAGRDRFDEAAAALKRAIAAAPNFLEAHRAYVRVRADFQGQRDEVKAEYEALMAKEAANPVYPLALALSLRGRSEMVWLKKVAELAPESPWGHYARSFVIQGRIWEMINETYDGKGEEILAEALKAITGDPTVSDFYLRAIRLQENLGKLDEALATAEQMAAQPALRAEGLGQLWRLRLAKARGAETEQESLRRELAKLAHGARDLKLLAAIREAYAALLKDAASAEAIERRIRRLDPAWYPERGKTLFALALNSSGLPYAIRTANRQSAIYEKLRQIVGQREADWRKESRLLEGLLALGPNTGLQKRIYATLFSGARKAGDTTAMIKYGERLHELDALDTAPLARIALALAEQKSDLTRALQYARRAEAALAEFRPLPRPPDIPAEEFAASFSLARQEQNHRQQQALALDAAGWVLSRMGHLQEAAARLRRSVALHRAETSLEHLAETLRQLGENSETGQIAREINDRLLAEIKRELTSKPALDFQLTAVDGRQYRLADLKGKVVVVSFWATWCGLCVAEMPLLVKAYEKYRERGFELLAISADDPADREQVRQFARAHRLTFPVLYDDGIARRYGAAGYPANVLIDRQGNIRWESGALTDGGRRLELLLHELLK